jgi:hypothetical protein
VVLVLLSSEENETSILEAFSDVIFAFAVAILVQRLYDKSMLSPSRWNSKQPSFLYTKASTKHTKKDIPNS